jgi:hypothetical protein
LAPSLKYLIDKLGFNNNNEKDTETNHPYLTPRSHIEQEYET